MGGGRRTCIVGRGSSGEESALGCFWELPVTRNGESGSACDGRKPSEVLLVSKSDDLVWGKGWYCCGLSLLSSKRRRFLGAPREDVRGGWWEGLGVAPCWLAEGALVGDHQPRVWAAGIADSASPRPPSRPRQHARKSFLASPAIIISKYGSPPGMTLAGRASLCRTPCLF